MKKKNYLQEDQINLAVLLKEIWGGRWLISSFIILALFIGLAYLQTSKIKYTIKFPYRINIYSVLSEKICRHLPNQTQKDWRVFEVCLSDRTLKIFLDIVGDSWSLNSKDKFIIHTTTSPLKTNEYKKVLSKAVKSTNEILIKEAITELKLIKNLKNDTLMKAENLMSAEKIATNELDSKRIISALQDNELDAITFASVSINKTAPHKVTVVLVQSVLFGAIIGMLFVFFRNLFKRISKSN